jgi:hypothetical protein
VAKVLDAEPLTAEEMPLFERCTGRARPPIEPPAEVFAICGRRSGKTRFAGACAVRAASRRYVLAPGERAVVALAASDREQARVVLEYATAPFREAGELRGLVERRSSWEALRALVSRETRWGLDLRTGTSIEVRTAHYGRVRGRTFALAVADEAAFWQAEDGSNPASEVFAAIRPGLATLRGQLLCITTPFSKSGYVWDTFSRYWGKDDARVLVWRAASKTMNPLLDEVMIAEALERDEVSARSEWLAEFREDVSAFITREAIGRVVAAGRGELAPRLGEGGDYRAFCDMASGAGQDSATLAVCHAEQDEEGDPVIVVVDAIREHRPPFDPGVVVAEFSEVVRSYGLAAVHGDRFGYGFVTEAFRACGVEYIPCERSKSELYRDLLPLLMAGRVELPDDPRLVEQLHNLERRAGAAGREAIDHGRGHDDRINAVGGAVVLTYAEASRAPVSVGVL